MNPEPSHQRTIIVLIQHLEGGIHPLLACPKFPVGIGDHELVDANEAVAVQIDVLEDAHGLIQIGLILILGRCGALTDRLLGDGGGTGVEERLAAVANVPHGIGELGHRDPAVAVAVQSCSKRNRKERYTGHRQDGRLYRAAARYDVQTLCHAKSPPRGVQNFVV